MKKIVILYMICFACFAHAADSVLWGPGDDLTYTVIDSGNVLITKGAAAPAEAYGYFGEDNRLDTFWRTEFTNSAVASDVSYRAYTNTPTDGVYIGIDSSEFYPATNGIRAYVNIADQPDHIVIPSNDWQNMGGAVSFCVPVRFGNGQSLSSNSVLMMSDIDANYEWAAFMTAGEQVQFLVRTASGFSQTGPTGPLLNDGAWHFVHCTYDRTLGSSRLNLYLDGILLDSDNGYDEDIPNIKNHITLATSYNATNTGFTAAMGPPVLWNVGLTQAEVSNHLSQIKWPNPSNRTDTALSGLGGYGWTKYWYDNIAFCDEHRIASWSMNPIFSAGNVIADQGTSGFHIVNSSGVNAVAQMGSPTNAYGQGDGNDYAVQATFLDDFPDEFSMSLWVNFPTGWTSAASANAIFVSKRNIKNQDRMFIIAESADGTITFATEAYNGGYTKLATPQTSWTADQWYNLTFTWGTQSGKSIYVDGVLATNDATKTTLMRDGAYSDFSLWVTLNGATLQSHFIGCLDTLSFYDVDLSTNLTQITNIYNYGFTGNEGP